MVSIIKFILSKTATLTLNISLTAERIWMKLTPSESSCENLQKMHKTLLRQMRPSWRIRVTKFLLSCLLFSSFFFFFPPFQLQHGISKMAGPIIMKLYTCIKCMDAQCWFDKSMTFGHDLDLQRPKVTNIDFGHISVTTHPIFIHDGSNCRSHRVLHFI